MRFGLMKSSCLLKQNLFPLFLRVRITLAPQTTTVQPLVGEGVLMGGWAIHHQEPATNTLRFQLAASALLLLFLPEVPIPARYFPVALSGAGDTVLLDSWAIHHQEPAHSTLQFQLAASALLLLFLPEVPTAAPFFREVRLSVGDPAILDGWVTAQQATNTLRFQLAASALLLLFLPEVPTPARYFPVALSGAGD